MKPMKGNKSLGKKLHKQPDLINEKLKSLYESVQEEEIPDRFMRMLEQLEEAERQSSNSDQDTPDAK